ncbi:ubiquinol-cytochrome C chaperone family protein [Faunimonas sp. B44]|uniref:ubiquinol-cytochrome C chaperone family protein n=1 Tax=Faunimonas sp. B44 TaxID=3461493 RepID=UPI004044D184
MLSFLTRGRAEREAGERIYAAIVAASRRPVFYEQLGVADTVSGRFEMLAVHFYPVVHRLMYVPEGDPGLARRVSEIFVTDMDDAQRALGIADLKVPKRMKSLYGAFAGRLTAYRDALAEGGGAVERALARNVFPEGAASGAAEALAGYLAAAVGQFEAASVAELRAGRLPYPEPIFPEEGGAS